MALFCSELFPRREKTMFMFPTEAYIDRSLYQLSASLFPGLIQSASSSNTLHFHLVMNQSMDGSKKLENVKVLSLTSLADLFWPAKNLNKLQQACANACKNQNKQEKRKINIRWTLMNVIEGCLKWDERRKPTDAIWNVAITENSWKSNAMTVQ